MAIDAEEIKSLVTAIAKQDKKSQNNVMLVRSDASGDISRYFFIVKQGGQSAASTIVKHVLNWIGNALQGAAMGNADASAGSTLAGATGKAASVSALSGAFKDGVMASAKDTGDEAQNRNLMHQLKGASGLQLVGFFDFSGQTVLNVWYCDPGLQSHYNQFIRLLDTDAVAEVPYSAKGSVLRGKRVLTMGGKSMSY